MFLKRPYYLLLPSIILAILLLTACNGSIPPARDNQPTPTIPVRDEPVEVDVPTTTDDLALNTTENPVTASQEWGEELSRYDGQGAVEVTVTPVNLENPGETIEFEVSLNTHSVDLSMDLAELALLRTDAGREVRAGLWDAPLGGHHVGGQLSFPAKVDGNSLIEGAREIRLIITGLDAPERIFIWQKP
jgi:hypothetical protein